MTTIVSRLGHVLLVACISVLAFAGASRAQTTDQPPYLNDDGLETLLVEGTPPVVSGSGERSLTQAQLTVEATMFQNASDAPSRGKRGLHRISGVGFRDLAPGDPLYGETSGVVVTRLDPDSPAARSDLEVGDIILAVNHTPVTTADELRKQLAAFDRAFALTIQRGTARIFLIVR